MAILKLNYNNISQMRNYFKSLEDISQLTFLQRRGLSRLNENIEKEFSAFLTEVQIIAEKYCEKDSDGNFITLENGAQKIKSEFIEEANNSINEIYITEIEIDYLPFKMPDFYFEQFQCDKSTFKLIEENFIE